MPNNADKSTPSYKVIFYNFKGATLWSHNAVEAGPKYLSTHPITHFQPPIENEFHDPDDSATKALQFWRNIIKPMASIKMAFGDKKELKQFEYSKIEVLVTKEEFQKAQESIDQQLYEGESGLTNYSVLRVLGKSCAESSQTVLEKITENTPEASLAKRPMIENISVWPQSHFNRVESVSKSREGSPSPEKVSLTKTGIFADSSKRNSQIKDGARIPNGMEIEQLTYF